MTKITKAEYDVLPESLKSKFNADGDSYLLIETTEDVEGLKRSKAEILAEKKRIQDERDEYKRFKDEHESQKTKTEEEALAKKGEFDQILANKEKAWNDRIAQEAGKTEKLLGTLHREQLKTELTKRGVLPDRVEYIANEYLGQTEFAMNDEGGFSLKKKGGVGDAAEFDAMIETAKTKTPFFFASTAASGSGASGSQQQGGSGTPKTATKEQLKAMSPEAKREFYLGGGEQIKN